MTVGMLVSSIFFQIADAITVAYLPASLYVLGIVILLMASMTGFIVLYVNVLSILGVSLWKRYFTTTLSVFLLVGTFGIISKLLMS
jgi:hypothetical protein